MGTLRPQIFTTERALVSFVTQAGARTAAMLGTAIWGPINSVQTLNNLSEFVSIFGDDKSGNGVTGIKGADLFFRNGGVLKFVRIEDGDAEYSAHTFETDDTDQLDVTAKYKGTYGNNIKVTITANAINVNSRDVTVTDGKIVEIFNNAGQGFATTTALINSINNSLSGSSLITVELNNAGNTESVPDAADSYLTGGDDGEDGTLTTVISTVFDDILMGESFNFLLIPGQTSDALHTTLVGKLNVRATTEQLYSRFISGVAVNETISTAISRTTSGKRATIVAPNVKYTNRLDGSQGVLDGSYLACAYAGLLCRLSRQISGTHETIIVEGLSIDTVTGREFYNKTEQEQLLQGKILPIAKIGGALQCVRGITRETSPTSIFFDEVVVDIADFIRESSEDYLNGTIGKPNTEARRTVWAAGVDSILETAKRNEIIQDYNPTEIVQAASPDTYIATISIKPSYSVNFINLNININ